MTHEPQRVRRNGEQIGVVNGPWFIEMFNRTAPWTPTRDGIVEELEAAQEAEGDITVEIDGERFRLGMADDEDISVVHWEQAGKGQGDH